MKKTLVSTLLFLISINGFSQKKYIDPETKQFITTTPASYGSQLFQHIVLYDSTGWQLRFVIFDEIKDCNGFIQFRKDYPMFYIPQKILLKFINCKK